MSSRIAAIAAGGEVLASNVVRELVAGKGLMFSDCGEFVPKDFEDADVAPRFQGRVR
jgi:class 3 adenylate cyclase